EIKKKILLINPPWYKEKDNIWSGILSIIPPIGLACIASYLEQYGHTVKIIDMNAENISIESLKNNNSFNDYDFIGITASTPLINKAYKIIEIIKAQINDKTKIILGGVHPSVLPEEAFEKSKIDYVIRGEGEQTFIEIVEGKKLSQIKGLSFKEKGVLIHNSNRELIKNLDELPLPAYHLLPMGKYRPALGAYRQLPGIGIITSRGCPGNCSFCFNIFGRSIRTRSSDSVMDEILLLYNTYKIREIAFYDDTFTVNKQRVIEICKKIIENKLKITWSCFARVDFIDEKILYYMKKAGCHQIMYGIESVSQEILDKINKKINKEKIINAVKISQKSGIHVRAAFMIGNPEETEKTIEESFEFAKELHPDLVVYNITTPYPGTKMYDWAEENGYLLTKDWEFYDLAHPVMNLPSISSEKIHQIYKTIFIRFYLRPSYLIRKLFNFSSFLDIKISLQALLIIINLYFKK
ncbi:MAG: radical SAM protein, partial [Candidatus Gastranaerophilaceae bacterium]